MRRLLLGCCLLVFAGLAYTQSLTLKLNQVHFQDEPHFYNTGHGIDLLVSLPVNQTISVDGGYRYSVTSVHSGNFIRIFGMNPSIYQIESSIPYTQLYAGIRFSIPDKPIHLSVGVGKDNFEAYDIRLKNIETGTTGSKTRLTPVTEESMFLYAGAECYWKSFVAGINYNHFLNKDSVPTGVINFSIGYQFDLSGVLK
ncbi:MAG: hypothetical protein HUU10_02050 [Bacteroidetes bacterium]|nr:hypothetical protein [Bacteroidota bacterium]